jgi:hypothetical protein
MMRVLVLFFLLAPLYFAVSNVDDDKRIKDALLKYNYGIIKMTRSGNTTLLKDMLPEKLYLKLMVWADSWKFSNLAMVAEINDFRFSPIAYNENNATIRTLENWTFGYADLVKRDYALEPMNMFYKMHYTLKKKGDQWMIVDIKILEEELFEKPKAHEPKVEEKKSKPLDDTSGQNIKGKIETH